MTKAKVISRKKGALIVQTEQEKIIIPASSVSEQSAGAEVNIPQEVLDQGIQYGIPFSSIFQTICITGEDLEKKLHSYGIWTYEDLKHKPNEAIAAILALAGLSYSEILLVASSYRKEK